jgi:hypothetical protein
MPKVMREERSGEKSYLIIAVVAVIAILPDRPLIYVTGSIGGYP